MTGDQRVGYYPGGFSVEGGGQLYVVCPIFVTQSYGFDGPWFSHEQDKDRVERNCRINGKRVRREVYLSHLSRAKKSG